MFFPFSDVLKNLAAWMWQRLTDGGGGGWLGGVFSFGPKLNN